MISGCEAGRLSLSLNRRHAIVVRIGEMKILTKALLGLEAVASTALTKREHKGTRKTSKRERDPANEARSDNGGKRRKR